MKNRKRKYSCLIAWLKRDKVGQKRIDNLHKKPSYFNSINEQGFSYNEY